MAIVVLFSTMSFTVDMHFCGDTLVDTAILHDAETCGMEMQDQSSEDCSIAKSNCCTDEQVNVDGQDELQLSSNSLTFNNQLLVATFVYTYINLFEGLKENVTPYSDYAPPLVIKQIYKLDETYLI